MKSLLALSALICVIGFGLKAVAEDGPCKKDMETLCTGVEPGEGRLRKCMMDNQDKLSAECKAKHEKMKSSMKEMHEACQDDAQKYCADEKPGHGRMMKCMKEHKDELSQACKDEMEKMKNARKKKK